MIEGGSKVGIVGEVRGGELWEDLNDLINVLKVFPLFIFCVKRSNIQRLSTEMTALKYRKVVGEDVSG